MKITPDEYSLLQELVAEYDYPLLDPNKHVTAKMLSDQTGLGDRACRNILNKKLKSGDLDREWVRDEHGARWYGYFKPQPLEPDQGM